MLRVDGDQVHPVLPHQGQHHRPPCHQGFFVGQGNVFAGTDGRQGWQQTGAADDPRHHPLGRRVSRHLTQPLRSGHQLRQRSDPGQQRPQLRQQFFPANGNHLGPKPPYLLGQEGNVAVAGQANNLKTLWILGHQVQSLGANRAGGAEQGDGLHKGSLCT